MIKSPSKTRVISYTFKAGLDADVFEMNRLLKKALTDKIITEYDDGRGTNPWMNGPPGKSMRAHKNAIIAIGYKQTKSFV